MNILNKSVINEISKGAPITDQEGPLGDVHEKVHIYTPTVLRRGRVTSPTLGRIFLADIHQYSFLSRLSAPQDQSGYDHH